MQKMFNEITDVAVDVEFSNKEHLWAVVCIAGRPKYVKFIPLCCEDAKKTVINFLKQFQYSKHIVNSPLKFKHMLNEFL